MINDVFVRVAISKNGNQYISLVVDVGYRLIPLTFNKADIAELLDISVRELHERYVLPEDERQHLYNVG